MEKVMNVLMIRREENEKYYYDIFLVFSLLLNFGRIRQYGTQNLSTLTKRTHVQYMKSVLNFYVTQFYIHTFKCNIFLTLLLILISYLYFKSFCPNKFSATLYPYKLLNYSFVFYSLTYFYLQ